MNNNLSIKEQRSFEVADIFRMYGEEYRANNGMTKKQLDVMRAIENCRSSFYGHHMDKCNECGHIERVYNSCRDRHCPKCQGISRRKWVESKIKELLPVPYYHSVFTLPNLLHSLTSYNKALIYDLLFLSSSETLLTFGHDPNWLGGTLGFYGVLHTWGQKLWQHPHVHYIIPGGAITSGNQWVPPSYGGKFLFPVRALSKVFRGKFIEGLKKAYKKGELRFPDSEQHLKQKDQFEQWINRLVSKNWIVYCKRPFKNPEHVVRYIGRYSHRVAISNQRILYVKKGVVHLSYKDYKSFKSGSGLWQELELTTTEFIRRFLLHVLPHGFHKIRHFGFLANGSRRANLSLIRGLLHSFIVDNNDANKEETNHILCPKCGLGKMVPFYTVGRFGILWNTSGILFKNKYAFDTS